MDEKTKEMFYDEMYRDLGDHVDETVIDPLCQKIWAMINLAYIEGRLEGETATYRACAAEVREITSKIRLQQLVETPTPDGALN